MVHYVLVVLMLVAVILAFGFVLWNFRKQRDFEGTGRTPPEDYD
jgi:hypothetical protein